MSNHILLPINKWGAVQSITKIPIIKFRYKLFLMGHGWFICHLGLGFWTSSRRWRDGVGRPAQIPIGNVLDLGLL